ncbi:hypothetical protein L1049_016835 [Liquidambar formosana]|uniref:Reverse transcriptase n=1 Tax=Liquidambar formosana TaxID=63359 RepID=A0AAP0S705_LIQFO
MFHTLRMSRGKFARISVEVDLNHPLVPKVHLGNSWQRVEYEGLHLICFTCGPSKLFPSHIAPPSNLVSPPHLVPSHMPRLPDDSDLGIALANNNVSTSQETLIRHLPKAHSNHCPILIGLQGVSPPNPKLLPFRFQAAWLTHDEFKEVMSSSWDNTETDFLYALSKFTKEELSVIWNGEVSSSFVPGQLMNLSKLKMFISPNLLCQLAKEISHLYNIPLTTDLGKYLGVPLIHSRVSKETYFYVLDKVQNRLSTWNGGSSVWLEELSLVQSVTSTISGYVMQSSKLLEGLLHQLDRVNCKFIWGSMNLIRKFTWLLGIRFVFLKIKEVWVLSNMSAVNNSYIARMW